MYYQTVNDFFRFWPGHQQTFCEQTLLCGTLVY